MSADSFTSVFMEMTGKTFCVLRVLSLMTDMLFLISGRLCAGAYSYDISVSPKKIGIGIYMNPVKAAFIRVSTRGGQ